MIAILSSLLYLLFLFTAHFLGSRMAIEAKPVYQATSYLWAGFLLLWFTAFGLFSPRDVLLANAGWIGSRSPRIARMACGIGMAVALGMVVLAISELLRRR